jgi:hypothetical protein
MISNKDRASRPRVGVTTVVSVATKTARSRHTTLPSAHDDDRLHVRLYFQRPTLRARRPTDDALVPAFRRFIRSWEGTTPPSDEHATVPHDATYSYQAATARSACNTDAPNIP